MTKGTANYHLKNLTLNYSRFLLNMTTFPEMIRNVAVVGHLHHGKTALMDMLVFETHKMTWDADKPVHIQPNSCWTRTEYIFLGALH